MNSFFSVKFFLLVVHVVYVSCYVRMKSTGQHGDTCVSECFQDSGTNMCYTGWSSGDYCKVSSTPGKIYYTAMTGGKYQCSGECGKFGYSYNWCYTMASTKDWKWDYCSSKEGYSIYDNKCLDECEVKSDGQYRCITRYLEMPASIVADNPSLDFRNEHELCSPAPIDPKDDYNFDFLREMSTKVVSMAGTCMKSSKRKKRISENVVRTIGVEELAARYERMYRRGLSVPSRMANTAATSYVSIPAPPRTGVRSARITLVLRATITSDIVSRARQQGRANIPNSISHLMVALDNCPGDERGHLLADSLGGETVRYNIVPQSASCNRCFGGPSFWNQYEENFRHFLDTNRNSYIRWTVVVTYGNLRTNRRPTGFGLRARFFDSSSRQVRDTGDCYFTNNPEGGSLC